jgi:hypothetical protein
VFEGVDYSLFRPDMDPALSMTYIRWLMEAYTNDVTERFRNAQFSTTDEASLAAEWAKYDAFMANLRTLFYQKED